MPEGRTKIPAHEAAWWEWLLHRPNAPFEHPEREQLVRDALSGARRGRFRKTHISTVPSARNDKVCEAQDGDFIDHFGFTFVWSKLHRSASQLEPLRQIGDPLLDEWLDVVKLRPSEDPIHALFPIHSENTTIRKRKHARDAKHYNPAGALCEHLLSTPAWVDWDSIARGQDVFVRHAGGAGIALLNCSLVGGFGAPKINKVLGSTGYLARSCQASFVRLFETLQMIVDCMQPGGMRPAQRHLEGKEGAAQAEWGGVGWRSCIRVRVLHGKVRRRLRAMGKWDNEKWGVPINQEDLSATLLSFSPIVLECLDFMKIKLTQQEKDDYTHLWRLIGYYSGILEENNPCSGGAARARASLESIVRHIVFPDATSAAMSNHMLRSTANRPPLHMPFEAGAQLSRMLLGHEGADLLKMPPEHRGWRLAHGIQFLIIRWISMMTRLPFGLGNVLMSAQRIFLQKVSVKLIGGRRTRFEMKFIPDDKHFNDIGCPASRETSKKSAESRRCARDSERKSAFWTVVSSSARLICRVSAVIVVLIFGVWFAWKFVQLLLTYFFRDPVNLRYYFSEI